MKSQRSKCAYGAGVGGYSEGANPVTLWAQSAVGLRGLRWLQADHGPSAQQREGGDGRSHAAQAELTATLPSQRLSSQTDTVQVWSQAALEFAFQPRLVLVPLTLGI